MENEPLVIVLVGDAQKNKIIKQKLKEHFGIDANIYPNSLDAAAKGFNELSKAIEKLDESFAIFDEFSTFGRFKIDDNPHVNFSPNRSHKNAKGPRGKWGKLK